MFIAIVSAITLAIITIKLQVCLQCDMHPHSLVVQVQEKSQGSKQIECLAFLPQIMNTKSSPNVGVGGCIRESENVLL